VWRSAQYHVRHVLSSAPVNGKNRPRPRPTETRSISTTEGGNRRGIALIPEVGGSLGQTGDIREKNQKSKTLPDIGGPRRGYSILDRRWGLGWAIGEGACKHERSSDEALAKGRI